MSDYPRKARQAKLNAAGYVYVSGWVRFGPVAELFAAQVEADREEVERIAAEPARPIGYPKGRPRKTVLVPPGGE